MGAHARPPIAKAACALALSLVAAVLLYLLARGTDDPARDALGRTVEQVLAQFPPDTPRRQFEGWDEGIRLGESRSYFAMDSRWLVLRARDGVVTEARIIED
jgi:hypothetical protein